MKIIKSPRSAVVKSGINSLPFYSNLAAAIAAVGRAGRIFVPSDVNIGNARVANIDGVFFDGPGKLQYVPSATLGTRVQNPAGRDRLVWGTEYLYEFLVKFAAGTATTVRCSGDSTTLSGADGYGPFMQKFLGRYSDITVTLDAHPGKHTGDWITSYLAADIAAANDLYIWHWGMNDCAGLARTLTQFEADLRSGLTSYRAAVPIGTGGIVLMTPNACSDGTNGRDEGRAEKMRHIIRTAAIDFQCAFVDTYGLIQDGYVGIGTWLDNTYGDGLRGIHPQAAFAADIAGEVLDLILPRGVRQARGEGGVINYANSIKPGIAADAPSKYAPGVQINRVQPANGWVIDGWVLTARPVDGNAPIQINWSYQNTQLPLMRTYNQTTAAWSAWTTLGGGTTSKSPAVLPAAMDAITTYPNPISIARATPAQGFPLDGYVRTDIEGDHSPGLYGRQVNWGYAADVPPQTRQWTTVGGGSWGAWRTLGAPATGTFTAAAAATTTVAETRATAACKVFVMPSNAAASAYVKTNGLPYVSARVAGTSFTLTFTTAPAGTENFDYIISY